MARLWIGASDPIPRVVRYVLCAFVSLSLTACGIDGGDRPMDRGQESVSRRTLTPREIAAGAFPSVVLLTMNDQHGQPLGIGSGFFVRPGVVATNYHVIENASSGTAKRVGRDETVPLDGVLGVDPGRDLALLAVKSATPTLTLSRATPVVGDAVYALGNPRGFEGTFSPGIVSAIRNVGNDSLLQITAPISPGSSGGPILDESGNVIGIATATIAGGQNLNFAVPVAALNKLVEGADTTPISFSRSQTKKGSLQSRMGADLPTTGVEGDRLQWSGSFDFQSDYTLSLRNKLRQPVKNVYVLVIFHDDEGVPLETDLIHLDDLLLPGLARRVHGVVDPSVKRMTTRQNGYLQYRTSPFTKVVVRVMHYEVGG